MSSSSGPQQKVFLIRHGETEWSRSGQHTGRTDIPLTEEGRVRARIIGQYVKGRTFAKVLTSPLTRAKETCSLAGLDGQAEIDDDLREWDYGIYEGRTTLDIRKTDPCWSVWLSPIEGGEALDHVAARAKKVIDRAAAESGDVALFAHGHILRILAATWIGLPPITGRYLALDTATVSMLGYERQTRVIREWNVTPRA
jgi:broad specificity phosphatase PhoE